MAAFRDMEELCQGLLSLLSANHAAAQQRRLLGRYGQMMERLLEAQDGAEQQLREILNTEKDVAQSLLDAKEQACQGVAELQQIEAKLQKASEEDTHLKANLIYPFLLARNHWASACPGGAKYVAQLYHRISKIEWDYECEPGMIKGIHRGPSVAQPIHLDSSQLSQKFISDYLWSLVDTEW
uniref:Kinetochore protein Spc24 n=1 Tax=Molossus molossus TaxID=27622 RepID=A0A7J8IC16_MOLMO|nr:SPC24 component of NDC80 kinetochore complex [Molossus molossus]